MGYVAVRGGAEAIAAAREFARYLRLRGVGGPSGSSPLAAEQIRDQMRLAVDRVMSEGSLYAPLHAALALKQAEGDTFEAAFILRAFRSTQPRALIAETVRTDEMRVIRRISAAFKEVPGGQILGPTRDYAVRLLDFALAGEDQPAIDDFLAKYREGAAPASGEVPRLPRVLDLLRAEGLVAEPRRDAVGSPGTAGEDEPFDVSRDALRFPAPRSARLQALARAETGGMMALAYSTMRGYGNVHPVVGELRVGYVPLRVRLPGVAEARVAGEVLVTEAEVLSTGFAAGGDGRAVFGAGYGLCFGQNEVKAISMAILDRAMDAERPQAPAEDEEFVLLHTDGIESSGFTAHWKLPHYVTFQSHLDRLRAARRRAAAPAREGC